MPYFYVSVKYNIILGNMILASDRKNMRSAEISASLFPKTCSKKCLLLKISILANESWIIFEMKILNGVRNTPQF